MKRMWIAVLLLLGIAVACSPKQEEADYRVVPLPQEITTVNGTPFILDNGVKILYPEGDVDMQRNAEFLAQYVLESTGKQLQVQAGIEGKNAIILSLGLNNENKEAYQLKVTGEGVTIQGKTAAGVFYGIQTLRKSLPVVKEVAIALPQVVINDAPRFSYRAMMLDVCRHYFTVDSIKRYIDLLALHNINRFHWHLTDDQGWRIEIKKYPQLTEIGSKRKETVIGRNSGEYDGKPYGGFYTQEDAKEIINYAKERYITVIPEIEMPGHMLGILSAFPELGCTGGPYEVWTMWGVSEDVICAGNPKSLELVKDVLAEIIDLFPSEYIHIGGDECPKSRWEKCPKCQAKIKALGLKGDKQHTKEERLQSYFISEVEKFVNSKGRSIIGWDEILEGGLAPNATVMAWRGVGEGVKAAKLRHDVVMVPTTYLYFDYYQANDREQEPLAIGGYVPLDKVYSFEPVPADLTPEEAKHIIGTQANLWTEYVWTFKHVEYMVLPRMDALSEVQWVSPEKKNYEDFLQRMLKMFQIYDIHNYNYAKHLFDIKGDFTPNAETKTLDISLSTLGEAAIHYTLDGSEPTAQSPKYTAPIQIKEPCTLKAVAIRPSGSSRIFKEEIRFSKATLKPIQLLQGTHERYTFKGAQTLVDGLRGSNNYRTGHWLGFYGTDLEAVIDMQEETEISTLEIATCVERGDWVFDARGLAIEISADGENFTRVAAEEYPPMERGNLWGMCPHKLSFDPVKTRYVKVVVKSERQIPEWHGGRGKLGFLFVDEIVLN